MTAPSRHLLAPETAPQPARSLFSPLQPISLAFEAFVAAGILSTNDEAYIREHGIEFHGFDGTRTGADVAVFETVCNRTKPPRRITGYADGHAEYRELTHEP